MKIVATNDYLVLVTKDDITGFVINSETHETYPEMSIAAILNHGDWDFVKDGENEDQVQKAEPNPQLDMTYAKPGLPVNRVGARAVVQDRDGNILIMRDAFHPEYWDIPGGTMTPGEDMSMAIGRELFEETGIKAQKSTPIFNKVVYLGGKNRHSFFYHIKLNDSKPQVNLSDEHLAYQWTPPADLGKYNIGVYAPIIVEALQKIHEAHFAPPPSQPSISGEKQYLAPLEQPPHQETILTGPQGGKFYISKEGGLDNIEKALPQGRVYLTPGQPVPSGMPIQDGPKGGKFYVPGQVQPIQSESPSLAQVQTMPLMPKKRLAKHSIDGATINQVNQFFSNPKGFEILEKGLVVDNPNFSTEISHLAVSEEYGINVRLRFMDTKNNLVGNFHGGIKHVKAKYLLMVLNKELQGQGLGSNFLENCEDMLLKLGVKTIELEANLDVGGYAWALQGFDFQTRRILGEEYILKGDLLEHIEDRYFKEDANSGDLDDIDRWEARRTQLLQLPKDQRKAMFYELSKFRHSWEFALYNPFNESWGRHLGKDLLLGSSWQAKRTLDPLHISSKVAQDYRSRRKSSGVKSL